MGIFSRQCVQLCLQWAQIEKIVHGILQICIGVMTCQRGALFIVIYALCCLQHRSEMGKAHRGVHICFKGLRFFQQGAQIITQFACHADVEHIKQCLAIDQGNSGIGIDDRVISELLAFSGELNGPAAAVQLIAQ